MRKQAQAVPVAQPAHTRAAWRVLALTRRVWRPQALSRPDLARLPPDERVRRLGEW